VLKEIQSKTGIVRSKIDVNTWLKRMPTVSEARPRRCAGCGVASCPTGGCLAVHGHGVRDRHVRGPPAVGGQALLVVIEARRYECQVCGAVMTVVPREVLPRMLFAATAIALALALFGLDGRSARAVRISVSPLREVGTPESGWKTLHRWIARAPSIWTCIRPAPPEATTRMRAERAATTLAAHAAADSLVHAAFAGAVHAR
jgi:ferredoxin